jgi:predicted ATPase
MGQLIANRYEIQTEIGAGGMGTVYLGLDRQTGSKLAIKQLKAELIQPDMLERFKREGQALRELNHPNIVKLLDAVEADAQHYLIMEYVAGGDLGLLLKHGRLPYQRCLNIAIDLADALTRAHRLNIIHRDLKPANVLLSQDGTVCLTDFGVAHVMHQERVTQTNVIIGTLDYLAPEVLSGEPVEPRSDIWAFGVMLFEMLAGQHPFPGRSILQVHQAIMTAELPDLEELAPDAPIAFVDLVYRMLNRDPQARISSVRHVGAELEDILHGREARGRFQTPVPDSRQRPRHNLPAQTTPFVGRERELIELARLIQNPAIRLISIIAQGGMGKTRLSLEAAERQIPNFAHGVYCVELAPLSEASSIIPAIANALGYQFQSDGREPKQQLLDYLQGKELLLLLDNFEHMLTEAGLVSDLLKAAPKLKILVTSRQRLDQSGESLFHLGGMDFPVWNTPEDALEYAAVKLFMNSATRAKANFELHKDNLDDVACICKLVQGMPLGIVLAAAWLGTLSPAEIASELQKGLDFLESDSQQIPERQRSMRAVMEYSWKQMSEDEQTVFAKLSVFHGGFTREGAEAVAGASLRILMSLVNKSFLIRDSDTARYEMLELLRQYAETKFASDAAKEEAQAAHSHFYLKWLAGLENDLKGQRQYGALNDIDKEYENILGAWIHAASNKDIVRMNQSVDSIRFYFDFRARFQEAESFFQYLPKEFEDSQDITVRFAYRRIRSRQIKLATVGLSQRSEEFMREMEAYRALAESLGETWEVGFAYCLIAWQIDERAARIEPLEKSVSCFRALQDEFNIADILDFLAVQYDAIGNSKVAASYYEESIRLHRKLGNSNGLYWALSNYAEMLMAQGMKEEGLKALEEADQLAIEIGNGSVILRNKMFLMRHHFRAGNFLEASAYIEQAHNLAVERNNIESRISCFLHRIRLDCYYHEDYAGALAKAESYFAGHILDYDAASMFENYTVTFTVIQYGLGNLDFVKQKLSQKIPFPTPRGIYVSICLAAFVLASEGKPEDAVRYLALLKQQPQTACGFVQAWPPFERHITQLKATIDAELFEKLWHEGKALDLDKTLDSLTMQFEP